MGALGQKGWNLPLSPSEITKFREITEITKFTRASEQEYKRYIYVRGHVSGILASMTNIQSRISTLKEKVESKLSRLLTRVDSIQLAR